MQRIDNSELYRKRRERYLKNKKKILLVNKAYYENNKDKIKQAVRLRYFKKHGKYPKIKQTSNFKTKSEVATDLFLRRKYSFSLEEYNKQYSLQKGLCAVCFNPEKAKQKSGIMRLAVDHCHDTKIVRGLLCHSCNIGIGQLKDNILLLENAIVYLKQYQVSR